MRSAESSPKRGRCRGAFVPINTLENTVTQANKTVQQMVREREKPRLLSLRKPALGTTFQPIEIHDDSTLDSSGLEPVALTTSVEQESAESQDQQSKELAFPLMDRTNQPVFGRPSPLGKKTTGLSDAQRNSAFIQPKPRITHSQPRLQEQAPSNPPQYPYNGLASANSSQSHPQQIFQHPQHKPQASFHNSSSSLDPYANTSRPIFRTPGEPVPIQSLKSNAAPLRSAYSGAPYQPAVIPPPRPLYSSNAGFTALNGSGAPTNPPAFGNANRDPDDGFDPNAGLGSIYDASNFVDATQASENIKALLEGAFDEDEDDKPKTRLRKRAAKKKAEEEQSAVDELTVKAKGLAVDNKDSASPVDEEEEDDGTIEGLSVRLLPHQIDGLAWMLDKEVGERKRNGVLPKGGILADDMGLGKTIQALGLILSNPRPSKEEAEALAKKKNSKVKIPEAAGKGTLVVAPLALIKQWESEFKDKVDSDTKLKLLVHHGVSRTKRPEDLKKYDVVITTYQTLTAEHERSSDVEGGLRVGCFGLHWYRVILDEAHSIKNRNAKMTKAAYSLKAVYRWCLTGTPMQNNLDELQSLIRFLNIKPYNNLARWSADISDPMKKGKGGLAIKRIQWFLKAFMKRRTKDVLKKEGALTFGKCAAAGDAKKKDEGFHIVERRVETIVTEFDEQEQYFYNRLAERTERSLNNMNQNDYIGALVLLLRLRQMCNHPDLAQGSLKQEDAIVNGASYTGSSINGEASKKSGETSAFDEMADLFGGLSVKTRKCDVCQVEIPPDSGFVRCAECEEDRQAQRKRAQKHHKKPQQNGMSKQTKRRFHTRRVIKDGDDEDDEEEGDWLVPQSQRPNQSLGKAGGLEDEDIEGGGEWLRSDDEDESESDSAAVGPRRMSAKAKGSSRLSESTAASEDTETDEEDVCTNSETESDYVTNKANNAVIYPSTKVRHLVKILERETTDHKVIVFSEFTSMLDIIEPFLAKVGLRYVRYDGKMRNDDREASLHALRTSSRVRILLCSLKSGSLGLNLTAASRVVILEPFWNPFVEEQAIDRVHRLNQTKDVVVYRLTVANTVEERILELQEKKRELAKAAIEGGKSVAKLSMQDILHLFKGNAEDHDGEGHSGLSSTTGILKNSASGTTERLLSSNRDTTIIASSNPENTEKAAKPLKAAAPLTPSKKKQSSQNSALAQAKRQRDHDRAMNGFASETNVWAERR